MHLIHSYLTIKNTSRTRMRDRWCTNHIDAFFFVWWIHRKVGIGHTACTTATGSQARHRFASPTRPIRSLPPIHPSHPAPPSLPPNLACVLAGWRYQLLLRAAPHSKQCVHHRDPQSAEMCHRVTRTGLSHRRRRTTSDHLPPHFCTSM